LIEAALAEGAANGYQSSTLESIAARAGVTTGAIYSIFGSKRELFVSALQAVATVPAFPGGATLAGALAAFGRLWCEEASAFGNGALYTLALEVGAVRMREAADDPALLDTHVELRDRLATELTKWARATGEPLPTPAEVLAVTVIATLQGLSQMRVVTGEPDPSVFAAAAAALATMGLP
jgi:AcrR family transcriptional regulator